MVLAKYVVIITGKDGYTISKGDIIYENKSIIELSPEQRALSGIFMSFQYPVMLGVNNTYFLKATLNAKLKILDKKKLMLQNS